MTNADHSRVVFAFVLSYTVMFSLGGRRLDAIATRVGLALSVAPSSGASVAHAFASGPVTSGASRFLLGVGEGACFPAARLWPKWRLLPSRTFLAWYRKLTAQKFDVSEHRSYPGRPTTSPGVEGLIVQSARENSSC